MTLRLIAKNTLWLTAAELTIKLIALAFNLILVRLVSVATFGNYNLVNAFIAIFSFLPDLGVNLIVIRELSADHRRYPKLIGQALSTNLIFSFLSFLAIVSLFPVFYAGNPDLGLVITLASLNLVVTSLRTIAKLGFDAAEKMHFSAAFTVINSLFSVIGSLAGFLVNPSLTGLFLGNLVGTSFSFLLEWAIAIKIFTWPNFSLHVKSLLTLIKSGLPLSLAAATALVSTRADTLILGRLLTPIEVGWYAAAQILIFSSIQLFNVPLMVAAYPALGRIKTAPSQFQSLSLKIIFLILGWTSLFTLLTWVLADPIIVITFGTPYLPAVSTLKLLSLLVPFAALSSLFYKILIVLNREKLYFWISSSGMVINLTTNLLLIPRLGITGAAIAAVLTHLSLFIVYGLNVKKLNHYL